MEANPTLSRNKRKQPSSAPFLVNNHNHDSASRLKVDEQRGEASGFSVLVKVLRTRWLFSPHLKQINRQTDEELSITTKKIGGNHCPPDVRGSKESGELGKLDQIEACVQTTPPEAVEVFDNSGRGLSHNSDQGSIKQSNIIRTSHFMSKNRTGPSMCARGRLFKPPSSFGYRRLLPYLMDVAKEDDSGVTRTCQNQKPKKGMEENLLQQVSELSQNQCLRSAVSPAVDTATPVYPMKGLSPCSVISPALMNEDLSEIRISSEDCNIIGNAPILGQSQVKQDPGKCIDSDTGECFGYAKMERGEADESNTIPCLDYGKLSKNGSMDDEEKVIPMDKEEDDKASIREQTCFSRSDDVIDSPNRSNLRASTAKGNAMCPVSKKASSLTGKSSNGTINENKSSSPANSKRLPTESKMVLKSCPRSKLFKSHNSFSYRRLLPYLMEIDKDDLPSTMRKTHPQEHAICSKENLQTEPEYSDHPKASLDVPNDHSPVQEFPLPCSLQKDGNGDELTTKVLEGKSESSPHKGKLIDELDPVMNEGDGHLLRDSTLYGASDHIGIMPMDTSIGILKRNPRGCRGLCPCLNCASFRLNAERAFEFSRNQMKDAEELALDLMKEMSHLQSLLQKINASAVAPDNKVLEACRKALEAEDIAKDRLSQMNEDLSVHCRARRLYRPRVMFSKSCAEDQSMRQ